MSKEKEKLESYLEKTFKLSWLNFEDMNIFHNMRVETGDPQDTEPVDIDEIEAIKASSSVRKRRRDVKEESQSQKEGDTELTKDSIDLDKPKITQSVDIEEEEVNADEVIEKGDSVATKLDLTNISTKGNDKEDHSKSVSPREEENDPSQGTKVRNTNDTIIPKEEKDIVNKNSDIQSETNEY